MKDVRARFAFRRLEIRTGGYGYEGYRPSRRSDILGAVYTFALDGVCAASLYYRSKNGIFIITYVLKNNEARAPTVMASKAPVSFVILVAESFDTVAIAWCRWWLFN